MRQTQPISQNTPLESPKAFRQKKSSVDFKFEMCLHTNVEMNGVSITEYYSNFNTLHVES